MPPRLFAFLCLIAATEMISAAEKPDADALFVFRIQPLLKEKCMACHGDEPDKLKSDYDMRTRQTLVKGGESGEAAVVPGDPDKSPFYLSVTRAHEDEWKPMPPKQNDKLSAEQVEHIKQWIADGAPWPDEAKRAELAKNAAKWNAQDGITINTTGALSPEWAGRRYKPENLWAYQPVRKFETRNPKSENPIDAFIDAKLREAGISPAPPCDARTFIRRATFDLTGLPPTSEEVDAFVHESHASHESHKAYEHLIDRLLNSPRYGEHWGRHWLDVVRYADSSGFANDYERGNAWRYRDYVIRSFNNDKPYDQFVIEQIAGDELAEANTEPITNNQELLIAPGFLRMGPWELTGMEVAKIARQRFLDDVTNSVGEVFLAHSLQCARCHDHKFDPIPTHDYYSMQACFATTQLVERPAPFLPVENTSGFAEKRYLEQRRADFIATLQRIDAKTLKAADAWFAEKKIDRGAWDKAVTQARSSERKFNKKAANSVFEAARGILAKQGAAEESYPPKQIGFTTEEYGMERIARKGLERLQWELDRYEPVAFSVYDGRTPELKAVLAPQRMPQDRMNTGELEQTAILGGGDPFSPTQPVKPGVLSVLSQIPNLQSPIPEDISGRRLALAQWIASKENPLTARVMMNRVWLWHFGQPIAGNPNNFGGTGKKPTHPELLDWLAATFMEKGWSLKEMHRVIMSSAAYRRSSKFPVPGSRLSREEVESSCAVFRPRRLTAEELRDAMLAVSGELNPKLGGIPARPEINLEAAMQPRQVMGTFASAWEPAPKPEDRHRRSVYALKIRGLRDPFMEVFNEPAPDFSCERRDASSVTPQVFSLFNGKASYDRALALAARVLKQSEIRNPKSEIERVFKLALGRRSTDAESTATLEHWNTMTAKHEKLTFVKTRQPLSVVRNAVEENTGEKFHFNEPLHAYKDFIPDLQPGDVDARTRALADVCLVLLNSNEFSYIY